MRGKDHLRLKNTRCGDLFASWSGSRKPVFGKAIKGSYAPEISSLDIFSCQLKTTTSAKFSWLNTKSPELNLSSTTMKLLYILLAVVPLALAAAPPPTDKTACKCALVKCVSTQPEVCIRNHLNLTSLHLSYPSNPHVPRPFSINILFQCLALSMRER